jgi:hypothetical protein
MTMRIEIGRVTVKVKNLVLPLDCNPPRCGVVELAVTELGSGLIAVGATEMIVKATSPGIVVRIKRVLDAKGNEAQFQGPPAWASSNESVLSLTPSEDGMSATGTIAGPVGNAQISVRIDADTSDEGVKELIGTSDVEVVAGEAATIELDVTEATETPV